MNKKHTTNKHPLIFGLTTAFLSSVGNGIMLPVIPFLIEPYVTNHNSAAMIIALLTTSYALCQFIASPGLGALSDRFGRRPVLLICLLGSAIGYIMFGIGGALWVLFIGRIIDGITGGNIGTLFSYFADITLREERTKYFGMLGAISGLGMIFGPVIGGLMSRFGYAAPMFLTAVITLLNLLYGFLFMPESLVKSHRIKSLSIISLNPLSQLKDIFSIKQIKWLLISAFLFGIPFSSLTTNFSLFAKDTFNWEPTIIGLLFFLIGVQDIITQSLILQKLLSKFGDLRVVVFGMITEIIGYSLIAASAIFTSVPLIILGTIIFSFGDALLGTALNGLASKSVGPKDQGRLQGSSQSVQALTRIIGPIVGGQLYVTFGHTSPYIMGIVLVLISILTLSKGAKAFSVSTN